LAILVLTVEAKAQTPISFGETKSNQKLIVAQNTVFTFTGTAGQLISIQMTQVSGDFVPTFDLLAPNGDVLKTVSDPGTRNARLVLFPLPASGTYRIICRDTPGSNVGSYNLSLTILKVDDSDNDGLPDSWEQQYFGDLRYGPDDDPDGDRLKNIDEFTK